MINEERGTINGELYTLTTSVVCCPLSITPLNTKQNETEYETKVFMDIRSTAIVVRMQ